MKYTIKILSVLLIATATLVSQAVMADWRTPGPTGFTPQNIVITLSENPKSNPERACLAVSLANALVYNGGQNVTIFAALDGVALSQESVVNSPRFKCAQSGGAPEITLKENLNTFLQQGNHNNLVLCTLCYNDRYGDEVPEYGVLPGLDTSGGEHDAPQEAALFIFMNADKVITI